MIHVYKGMATFMRQRKNSEAPVAAASTDDIIDRVRAAGGGGRSHDNEWQEQRT